MKKTNFTLKEYIDSYKCNPRYNQRSQLPQTILFKEAKEKKKNRKKKKKQKKEQLLLRLAVEIKTEPVIAINMNTQVQPCDRLPERLIELTFMGVATTNGASGESLTA